MRSSALFVALAGTLTVGVCHYPSIALQALYYRAARDFHGLCLCSRPWQEPLNGELRYYPPPAYRGCKYGDAFKNLHFELCYYQALEYAIEHKLEVWLALS